MRKPRRTDRGRVEEVRAVAGRERAAEKAAAVAKRRERGRRGRGLGEERKERVGEKRRLEERKTMKEKKG